MCELEAAATRPSGRNELRPYGGPGNLMAN